MDRPFLSPSKPWSSTQETRLRQPHPSPEPFFSNKSTTPCLTLLLFPTSNVPFLHPWWFFLHTWLVGCLPIMLMKLPQGSAAWPYFLLLLLSLLFHSHSITLLYIHLYIALETKYVLLHLGCSLLSFSRVDGRQGHVVFVVFICICRTTHPVSLQCKNSPTSACTFLPFALPSILAT